MGSQVFDSMLVWMCVGGGGGRGEVCISECVLIQMCVGVCCVCVCVCVCVGGWRVGGSELYLKLCRTLYTYFPTHKLLIGRIPIIQIVSSYESV